MVSILEIRSREVGSRRTAIARRAAFLALIGLLSIGWHAGRDGLARVLARLCVGDYQRQMLLQTLVPIRESAEEVTSFAGSARHGSAPGILYETTFIKNSYARRLRLLDIGGEELISLPAFAVVAEPPLDRDGDGRRELMTFDFQFTEPALIVYRARPGGVDVVGAIRMRQPGLRWVAPWAAWDSSSGIRTCELVMRSTTPVQLLSGDMAVIHAETCRARWSAPGGVLVGGPDFDWTNYLLADLPEPVAVVTIDDVTRVVEEAFERAGRAHPESRPATAPAHPQGESGGPEAVDPAE